MENLFIVGAQRSGSTYLYHMLDCHPQISMIRPVRPEPKFFMNEQRVAQGRAHYERSYFADRKSDTRYLGEKSTSYIERPEVASRIRSFYPDARILMILRDPVLRAYSNYRFSVKHKLESLTFAEGLAAESERLRSAAFTTSVTPYAYRKRGHYIDYIQSYLDVFDMNQICILIFEEFVNDQASVQRLYSWLGVEPKFVPPSLDEVFNAAFEQKENQLVSFRDLALGYQDSISRLEHFLGYRIESWRERHREFAL